MTVLLTLAADQGQIVSRDDLLDAAWPGTVVSDHALFRCIYQLRRQLREVAGVAADLNPIETIPKRGYRLMLPMQPMPAGDRSSGGATAQKSIAVLPFVDMSAQHDQEYLGDGIAEELINGLAKLGDLRVAARTSSFQFKGKSEDISAIGEELGVSAILEGSVRKAGNRLRITAQLIDATNASHLWSDSYDRELSDIFELQDDVAGKVINALRVELRSETAQTPRLKSRLMNVGTESQPAYDNYLLGMHQLRKLTEQAYWQAIAYFERAIEHDPGFARAYSGLGWSCTCLVGMYGASPDELSAKAKAAYDQAEALGYEDPLFPWDEIHRMVDPTEYPTDEKALAIDALDKLSAEDPSGRYFEYCQVARSLTKVGLFETALDFYELYLKKGDYQIGEVTTVENEVCWVLMGLGRYDQAIAKWTDWIEVEPDDPMHRAERSYIYSRRGQYKDAERDVAVASATWSTSFARFYFLLCSGDVDAAREHFRRLEQNRQTWLLFKALGRLLLEDIEEGIDYLEEMTRLAPARTHKGSDRNWPIRLHLARFCPAQVIESVTRHSRYRKLMRSMGLDDEWRDELMERINRRAGLTGIRARLDREAAPATLQGA